MSRISNIIIAIQEVFESTSGFDLTAFEGDTTFFEMGLASLVLTQTATSLKKEMDFELTFRQLLEETPTVDSLAQWLDEKLPSNKYAASRPSASSVAATPVAATPVAPAPVVSAVPQESIERPAEVVSPQGPSQTAPVYSQPNVLPQVQWAPAVAQSMQPMLPMAAMQPRWN